MPENRDQKKLHTWTLHAVVVSGLYAPSMTVPRSGIDYLSNINWNLCSQRLVCFKDQPCLFIPNRLSLLLFLRSKLEDFTGCYFQKASPYSNLTENCEATSNGWLQICVLNYHKTQAKSQKHSHLYICISKLKNNQACSKTFLF